MEVLATCKLVAPRESNSRQLGLIVIELTDIDPNHFDTYSLVDLIVYLLTILLT